MRGKPKKGFLKSQKRRITPADAGKTKNMQSLIVRDEDHPRGCGENIRASAAETWTTGSPPRMRGKPVVRVRKRSVNRITPADAGKTKNMQSLIVRDEDHPRGCGENALLRRQRLSGMGSPPRMRGKHLRTEFPREADGITPADAGKTIIIFQAHLVRKDHPRGCGENASR